MAVAPRLSPFEVLDLRMLRASALAELFEEERRHWEGELRWDYGPSVDLLRRHIDAHSLPGYVALWHGRVVGYCFFVYEDQKGLLGDLYVLAAHRGPGGGGGHVPIATTLLEHALETLEQSPVIERIEAQLLGFGLEALEPFFRARGYRVFPRLFMLKELQEPLPEGAPATSGAARLRPWHESDFDPAAELIVSAYQEHIDSQINDHYSHASGALRFLKNIILFPGCGVFRPRWSYVAEGGGRLEGAVLVSEVADGVAHITQICVRPESQKHGLGRRLLQAALESAAGGGCTGISLTVTAENRSAVALYRRLGFGILKEFSAFTRTVR